MATVTRENIGNLHDKINVKLTKDDYMPAFEKALKQYAKQANVPGFRKGAVPAGMVKKMYGQSLFADEIIRTASRSLENYLNDNKIGIFAQPMIISSEKQPTLDMNNPADAEFAFEIGVKPEIKIPLLDGNTKLTKYKVTISDKMLDDETDRITKRYGKIEDEEAVSHKEMVVFADVQAVDANGNALQGTQKQEVSVQVDQMPEKIQDMLMGKKAGDVFTITPSKDLTEAEIEPFMQATKAAANTVDFPYQWTVTRVGRVVPRELDALFFSELFPNENITDTAGFREQLRIELGKEFDRIASNRIDDEIYEALVHKTPVELPVTFLKRWLTEGQEQPKTPEQVEQEFPSFEHQLRWQLVSDQVFIDNNIRVSEADVKEEIKGKVLSYFGMENTEDAPWMDSYMEKVAKDEKTMNETYRQLMFARLFDFLRTKFILEEQEIGEEEFFKLPSAHAMHHHH